MHTVKVVPVTTVKLDNNGGFREAVHKLLAQADEGATCPRSGVPFPTTSVPPLAEAAE